MDLKLNGTNAIINVYTDYISIKKSWFITRIFKSNKLEGRRISYSEIGSINFKKGSHLGNGKLEIVLDSEKIIIIFKKISNDKAKEIEEYIKRKI